MLHLQKRKKTHKQKDRTASKAKKQPFSEYFSVRTRYQQIVFITMSRFESYS